MSNEAAERLLDITREDLVTALDALVSLAFTLKFQVDQEYGIPAPDSDEEAILEHVCVLLELEELAADASLDAEAAR